MSRPQHRPTAHRHHVHAGLAPSLRWMVSFARLPARRPRRDDPHRPRRHHAAALAGGLLTGTVLGAVQAWAMGAGPSSADGLGPRHRPSACWPGSRSAPSLVDFRTGLGDLVLQGASPALSSAPPRPLVLLPRLGSIAFVVARPTSPRSGRSAGPSPPPVGIQVEDQFTVFGAAGAITVTLLTAVLPVLLNRPFPHREERLMTRHVVFGTGQVGHPLVEQLVAAGHDVVAVNRDGRGTFPGATVVGGDATDPAFTTAVCAGADVVYFCLNAMNYERWNEEFPPLQRGVLAGCRQRRRPARRPRQPLRLRPTRRAGDLVETMAANPTSAKSATRAAMTEELLARPRRGTRSRSPSAVRRTTSVRARLARPSARRSSVRRSPARPPR